MLFAILPIPYECPPISPNKFSLAFSPILNERPLITLAIYPSKHTFSVHLISCPFPSVWFSIRPFVSPLALDFILRKHSFIIASVQKLKFSSSFFQPIHIISTINGSIGPRLLPKPMLFVIEPLTFIFRAVWVKISATSLCLVVNPIALVNITIVMNQFSTAVCQTVSKLTLVLWSVNPYLNAETVFFVS